MGDDPKKSVPPDPAAAKVAQDLLAQIHKDFVVERKIEVPVGDANKGAQLGQALLAQLEHDFGERRRAEDEARLHALGQQLLGAITRDFGSVRPPGPGVGGSLPSIPPAPHVPSSPGTVAAPLAAPPGSAPPPAATITLAPPPPPELLKAEEELQKLEAAPLAEDEEAELEAIQGGRGALGFLRKLFKR